MTTQKTTRKHSPGPWFALLNAPGAIIPGHLIKTKGGAQLPIALLPAAGGTECASTQTANARLMAAAPELLDVLRKIVIKGYLRPGPHEDMQVHPDLINEARLLIATIEEGK